MENKHDHVRLTSGEIASLWGTYLNDSLGICTLTYFLKGITNAEIQSVAEFALGLSNKNVEFIKQIFNDENFPLPIGFSEKDVNLDAKKLFSDSFILYYIQNMGSISLNSYSIAVSNSARKDIRDFYRNCLNARAELYERASDVMLAKGIFIRCPSIPYPSEAEFIHKKHFLSGWFGVQRPLTSIEISFLYLNLYHNTIGTALLTGFSQVAKSKDVRKHMFRGAEIAKHHSMVFSKILSDSNLETPMSWDIMPFDSVEAPFSDHLMMFHTFALNSSGFGLYGASLGGSARRDLSASYGRLLAEVGDFSEDGAKMMIENGWFEKPPSAVDRKNLALG